MKPFTGIKITFIFACLALIIGSCASTHAAGADDAGSPAKPACPAEQANVFPPAADSAYYLAGQYLTSGHYDEALSYFDQAIKLASIGSGHFRIADAFYSLGNANVYLGRTGKAIDAYSRAIQLDKNYALAYYMRGQVYEGLSEHGKAVDDFKAALAIDPNLALAGGGLALAYQSSGEHEKAIEAAGRSINLDAGNAWFYDIRAKAYRDLGQWDKFIEDMSKVIQLLSSNTASGTAAPAGSLLGPAYFHRGQAYQKLGKIDLARQDLDKARQLGYQENAKPDAKLDRSS